LRTDKKNENDLKTPVTTQNGYKINAKNTFKIISQLFSGQRHFSGTLTRLQRSI
jgi:hypothetical protein